MVSRRGRALVLAATTVAVSAGATVPQDGAPRSVLLVTLDTTRADHLGCYGAELAATPNLDALARQGVRFDEAISPAPLTLPSHASILTGRVPRRHGVRNNALFRLGQEPEVLAAVLHEHGYRTAAFVSSVVLDRITGLHRGFEHYDDTVRIGPREAFNYEERAAGQTNEAVLRHLDSLKDPFFLWVHYFDPHLPYVPPEPYRGRFAERPYDGEIAYVDDRFGELLAAVRRKAASLLVVVAGDHGESLGEHGEDSHGIFVYRATQRVPLVFWGPGVPRGVVVSDPVGLVDVAPTVLDLLDLPLFPDADGRSLVARFRGEETGVREYELESFFPFFSYGWTPLRALVRGEYKYIEAPRSELYRLSHDPDEIESVAAIERNRATVLATHLRSLTARDVIRPVADDPGIAEQRRRLESLGYVTGRSTGEKAAVIDPKDGIGWIADLEAGRRAYQAGAPEKGIEPLRRLLSRNPGNVPALLTLARCHLGAGRPDKAVEAGRRALEIRPHDDLIHFNLANALAALGEENPDALREARTQYERALELNPRFADAYLNYASLLERIGSDAAASSLLRRAPSAGVRDPDLEMRIAALELKAGNVEPAKSALRRALELHPRAAGPLEALARIAQRQGRHGEAAGFYERLLEVSPSAEIARTLGSIRLHRLRDPEGARRAYVLALALMAADDPDREALQSQVDELTRTE